MIFINLPLNTEDEHSSGIVKTLFLCECWVQKETEHYEVPMKKQPSEGLPYERLICILQFWFCFEFFFFFFFPLTKAVLVVHVLNAHRLIIYAS